MSVTNEHRGPRFVVGADGSDGSLAALGWTGRFARELGAEVVAATMFEPDQAEVSPERHDDLMAAAHERLEVKAAELLDPLGVMHRAVVEPGSADGLLDIAQKVAADLLVVGPRGDGGFARLHVGSTAHHLAHHAKLPLAIVPVAGAERRFQTIVVGVDLSSHSQHALAWCSEVARATRAEVVAVHALEPFLEWVPESDPGSILARRRADLDKEVEAMRDQGVRVRCELIRDIHPVAALRSAIDREGADLAVVGRRGHGGFSGLLLGRVPEQLVHHAQVPVVVVPGH